MTVRYLVKDVSESVKFYTSHLGFSVVMDMSPAFAKVAKEGLELWLSGPTSSAVRPMPDGEAPESGGWNRFVIETNNLVKLVDELKKSGLSFRNDIVIGPGGKQILLEDPSGNPIELFEPA
jgi:catechol 2,3-dioxygenase-like lactoylglutathione lyase family enzyme